MAEVWWSEYLQRYGSPSWTNVDNSSTPLFSLSAESEQNGGSDGCSEGVGVDVGCWAMYCGKGEVQITAVVEKQRPF